MSSFFMGLKIRVDIRVQVMGDITVVVSLIGRLTRGHHNRSDPGRDGSDGEPAKKQVSMMTHNSPKKGHDCQTGTNEREVIGREMYVFWCHSEGPRVKVMADQELWGLGSGCGLVVTSGAGAHFGRGFREFATEGVGEDVSGVLGKIIVDDPAEESGFHGGEVAEFSALVAAEIDDDFPVLPFQFSGPVDKAGVAGTAELVEFLNIGGQGFVLIELPFEHIDGGDDIGKGAMGVDMIAAAVEHQGGGEGAGFHFMEDLLGIDDPSAFHGEGLAGAVEFLDQEGNIIVDQVVTTEIAMLQYAGDFLCEFPEGRAIFHIVIPDAMDLRGFLGDGALGMNAKGEGFAGTIGLNADDGEVDDPVHPGVDPGGFDVKDGKGTISFQFPCHGGRIAGFPGGRQGCVRVATQGLSVVINGPWAAVATCGPTANTGC